MAILAAIIILMSFTPLGFLKIGIVDITFIPIPVAVGAILLGPAAGAILGLIFGICSVIQALGMSAFGVALMAIDPLRTIIVCIVPRVLCGWLSGLIFKALFKHDRTKLLSYGAGGLAAPLFNTVFFMALLLPLLGNSDYIKNMRGAMPILAFAVAFVGVNALIEAVACTVISAAIAKAVMHYTKAE